MKDKQTNESRDKSTWYRDPDALLEGARQSGWPAAPLPSIAGYDELSEIRRGGQGVVYRATQRSTNRAVAIKVLLEGAFATQSERRRFEREIELVATLRHPNIVRIYDSGVTSDGRLYFVMEYLEGASLNESRTQDVGPTSIDETLKLFIRICDAVHYAHQRGVIHRDLKPGNIRIDSAGEPHILDFGLAKAADASQSQDAQTVPTSMIGEFVGSLPWASPEQAEGVPGGIDIRTDVYSLGVMLYRALTGRFPYRVEGPLREVLNNILSSDPVRPATIRRQIDNDLETILLKCLHKTPDRRYQTAGDLARELRHYQAGEPIEAKRDSHWYVISKTLRRHKLPTTAAFGFLVTVIAFGITMSFLYARAVAAEKTAEDQKKQAQVAANNFAIVNEFLLGAFVPGGTDPDRGRTLTVRDGVDAAAAQIQEQYADKPEISAGLHQAIGYWYGNLGEQELSEQQHLASLAAKREVFGDRHPNVASQLLNLGWGYVNRNELEKAEQFFRESLDIRREAFPDHERNVAYAAGSLGYVKLKRDDPAAALPLMTESVEILGRILPKDHVEIAHRRTVAGECLTRLGRYAEAEPLLLKPYEIVEKTWGVDNRNTQAALERVIQLYEAWNKPDRADPYRAKLSAGR